MSSFAREIILGLILAATSLLWVTLEYAVGLHTTLIEYHPIVTNFFALIPIYILYLAIRARRAQAGGQLGWGQGILSGIVVSLVPAVLAYPSFMVFITFVNPGFFSSMIEYAVTHGKATREEAEAYFSLKSYILQGTIFPLVAGVITALIITAILRRTGKKSGPSVQGATVS